MRFTGFGSLRRLHTILAVTGTIVMGFIGSQAAHATSFTWGDVDPGDEIDKIIMAAGSLSTFNSITGELTMTGDITTITFVNKASISGITGVTFSADLTLTSTDVVVLPFPPFSVINPPPALTKFAISRARYLSQDSPLADEST